MAKLYYRDNDVDLFLGEIVTNQSMTVDNALDLLGVNMDEIADSQGWDGWDFEKLELEYGEDLKVYKNLEFYGDAYQGETFGDRAEFYQYCVKDGSTYRAIWTFSKDYLDTVESMDDIILYPEDIDRIEKVVD